jgi:hypothetical protein
MLKVEIACKLLGKNEDIFISYFNYNKTVCMTMSIIIISYLILS